MRRTPEDEASRGELRRAGTAGAADAVAILREVAAHFARRGSVVWTQDELREADFVAAARAGELILGYSGGHAAATMLLQFADPLYWPDAAPNTALYVHKVAVKRAFAGQGWLNRLVAFAADEATARGVPHLRLDTLAGPALRPLYERLGFAALDEPPIRVAGRCVIRMERRL